MQVRSLEADSHLHTDPLCLPLHLDQSGREGSEWRQDEANRADGVGGLLRSVLLLLVLAVLLGCGLRRLENVTTPYVATEYLPYAQPGSASIAGTLSGRTIAGQAMTCADMDVMLVPATAYTREGIRIMRAGRAPSGRASPDKKTLLRSTAKNAKCDAKGHFAFDGLATGSWLLVVELRLDDDDSSTGAMIREIPVAVGEIVTVAFADADYTAR